MKKHQKGRKQKQKEQEKRKKHSKAEEKRKQEEEEAAARARLEEEERERSRAEERERRREAQQEEAKRVAAKKAKSKKKKASGRQGGNGESEQPKPQDQGTTAKEIPPLRLHESEPSKFEDQASQKGPTPRPSSHRSEQQGPTSAREPEAQTQPNVPMTKARRPLNPNAPAFEPSYQRRPHPPPHPHPPPPPSLRHLPPRTADKKVDTSSLPVSPKAEEPNVDITSITAKKTDSAKESTEARSPKEGSLKASSSRAGFSSTDPGSRSASHQMLYKDPSYVSQLSHDDQAAIQRAEGQSHERRTTVEAG